MSTCKTCKHWVPPSEHADYPSHGKCSSSKFIYVGQDSTDLNEETDRWEYPKKEDDSFLYEDCESYAAKFYTGPNFGCIHYGEKA